MAFAMARDSKQPVHSVTMLRSASSARQMLYAAMDRLVSKSIDCNGGGAQQVMFAKSASSIPSLAKAFLADAS